MFKLGAIPSEYDKRDYPIALVTQVKTEHAKSFRRTDFISPIKNQGNIGSCVAHSDSYLLECFKYVKTGAFEPMSVGFIYGNRVGTVGGLLGGEGMSPRDSLKNLQKYGDVPFDDFPVNATYPEVASLISTDQSTLYQKAAANKIATYVKITTEDEIKTALETIGCVTIMIPVYTSFYAPIDGLVPIPQPTEHLDGYHEITILGWREDNTWIVANSWGENWGDKGFCYIPFEFPIQEAWSVADTTMADITPFINSIKDEVIREYREFGILPSATLAQACLESAYGTHAPGNMLFGVKWSASCGYDKQLLWTWEYLNGKWVRVQAYFRKYDTLADSLKDHAKLLTTGKLSNGTLRYQRVIDAIDYKTACQALYDCGYATHPAYVKSLVGIIKKFNLNKYDGRVYKMYNDASKISPWALPYVEKAAELGIMIGDDKGNFNPQNPITREQMAKIICELKGVTV